MLPLLSVHNPRGWLRPVIVPVTARPGTEKIFTTLALESETNRSGTTLASAADFGPPTTQIAKMPAKTKTPSASDAERNPLI
jgi:hypothetical protein